MQGVCKHLFVLKMLPTIVTPCIFGLAHALEALPCEGHAFMQILHIALFKHYAFSFCIAKRIMQPKDVGKNTNGGHLSGSTH